LPHSVNRTISLVKFQQNLPLTKISKTLLTQLMAVVSKLTSCFIMQHLTGHISVRMGLQGVAMKKIQLQKLQYL